MRTQHSVRCSNPASAPAEAGFSIVQILIAAAILVLASLSVLSLLEFALKVVAENKLRTGAVTIANEIVETIHNLPYSEVGTVGGIISGSMPQEDTVLLNRATYTVTTSVTFIDDPFDGTVAAGSDTLGNDYKQIRISIEWQGWFGARGYSSVSTS